MKKKKKEKAGHFSRHNMFLLVFVFVCGSFSLFPPPDYQVQVTTLFGTENSTNVATFSSSQLYASNVYGDVPTGVVEDVLICRNHSVITYGLRFANNVARINQRVEDISICEVTEWPTVFCNSVDDLRSALGSISTTASNVDVYAQTYDPNQAKPSFNCGGGNVSTTCKVMSESFENCCGFAGGQSSTWYYVLPGSSKFFFVAASTVNTCVFESEQCESGIKTTMLYQPVNVNPPNDLVPFLQKLDARRVKDPHFCDTSTNKALPLKKNNMMMHKQK